MTQKQTIEKRFAAFDAAHPDVYETFRRIAETALRQRTRFSAHSIVQIIRWERATSNDQRHDGGFKINDHFARCYGRKLMAEDARFVGFFETRRLWAA